ncbi:hypothetical protein FB45DRAFT_1063668 [Roridomyces roridus]|uniref:Zn(2)-C6 fungal-type domain-containing protein n=1 Tax=Roridomyces roridus TaxID=1738132 RepID=A0AAD7BCK1_9AGAR|nr:hypothetical protein FB45DRAFT_1063668 [Roridomyces roridus]
MSSHTFQMLSDQEVLDLKRNRRQLACAECHRRKLKCDENFPCASCVRRGRADLCPTGDLGFIGRGRRIRPSAMPDPPNEGSYETDMHPLMAGDDSADLQYTRGDPGLSSWFTAPDVASSSQYSQTTALQFTTLPIQPALSSGPPPSIDTLRRSLPPEPRALSLYQIYVSGACQRHGPYLQQNDLQTLIARAYEGGDQRPQDLAMVLLVLAYGARTDVELPPLNSEAYGYVDAGLAALALDPILSGTGEFSDSSAMQTLSALLLAAHLSGPYTERAVALGDTAVALCRNMRLHRESSHEKCEYSVGQARRAMFWEVHFLDTHRALSFARPLFIPREEITFDSMKWRFTAEVTSPVAELFTRPIPPSYDQVLALDGRIRSFMAMDGAPNRHHEEPTFLPFLRKDLIPRFGGKLLLLLHRKYFLRALKENPMNPLQSVYAPSYLSAYHGAAQIIDIDVRSFTDHRERFNRWWPCPIWKTLLNSALVMGSIVVNSPGSELATTALPHLGAAVDVLHHAFMKSPIVTVQSSLPALRQLLNRATAIYAGQNTSLGMGQWESNADYFLGEGEDDADDWVPFLSGDTPAITLPRLLAC